MKKVLCLAVVFMWFGQAFTNHMLSESWMDGISRSVEYVTLPDIWPIEAEFTPVSLERMVMFKYACMAHLAGYMSEKPSVNPSVETWMDQHTKLFRRYSVSLEARIFGYLQATPEEDQLKCSLLIGFINMVQDFSMQELAECQASIASTLAQIEAHKADIESNIDLAKEKVKSWVGAKLLLATGATPDPLPEVIQAEIDALCLSIANEKKCIEHKTFLKNEAFVHGISVDWVVIAEEARKSLRDPVDVDLETNITNNNRDQIEILEKISNNQFAIDYLGSQEHFDLYGQDFIDALKIELMTKDVDLKAALEQKRIDCDQGLLGGEYNPEDYINPPPPSNYQPKQVKMVSFPAFKRAWDESGFDVVTEDQLNSWQLNFI